jgi:hypothetical protein
VIAELREHMLAGRLTPEEFEKRRAAAHRARTREQIDAVTADLPQSDQHTPASP